MNMLLHRYAHAALNFAAVLCVQALPHVVPTLKAVADANPGAATVITTILAINGALHLVPDTAAAPADGASK
jgi:hypothetical protein